MEPARITRIITQTDDLTVWAGPSLRRVLR
jgi:hypothetical protein